jgi:ribonuclease T2
VPYRAPEQQLRVTTAQFKKDFEGANAALADAMLAPICSGSNRYLSELQVCFAQDGKPVACSSEVQQQSSRSCANADILIRNVR